METPPTLNRQQFQDQVLRLVMQVLTSREADLRVIGLRPAVESHVQDAEHEIAVYFYAADELVDVLEFSAVRSGSPVSTLTKIEAWLQDGIGDVIRRHGECRAEARHPVS